MKVDNYKIESGAIADVIEKLAEADGAPGSIGKLFYLSEAAQILAEAVARIATDDDWAAPDNADATSQESSWLEVGDVVRVRGWSSECEKFRVGKIYLYGEREWRCDVTGVVTREPYSFRVDELKLVKRGGLDV